MFTHSDSPRVRRAPGPVTRVMGEMSGSRPFDAARDRVTDVTTPGKIYDLGGRLNIDAPRRVRDTSGYRRNVIRVTERRAGKPDVILPTCVGFHEIDEPACVVCGHATEAKIERRHTVLTDYARMTA